MGLLLILIGLMLLIHLINFKNKITGQTAANNNDGNIAGRVILEMPLINC